MGTSSKPDLSLPSCVTPELAHFSDHQHGGVNKTGFQVLPLQPYPALIANRVSSRRQTDPGHLHLVGKESPTQKKESHIWQAPSWGSRGSCHSLGANQRISHFSLLHSSSLPVSSLTGFPPPVRRDLHAHKRERWVWAQSGFTSSIHLILIPTASEGKGCLHVTEKTESVRALIGLTQPGGRGVTASPRVPVKREQSWV